mgnify:CR=1 FL=1
MEYCIETNNLTKAFGEKVAVVHLNIQVEQGSFYGFLGPNGAGKSTTIKMLTGILGPTAGDARILGYRMDRQPLKVKQRIGVVPEQLSLFENLNAQEYLMFIGRMYKMPKPVIQRRSEELLALLGLADTGNTLTLEFSHGMKKKLSLAGALIHDPDLLFLDEPFEGIDAIASRTIRTVLEQFVARGSTIFITSHILEIVERLCSHVGIISQGSLVQQGTLAEVTRGGRLEEAFVNALGDAETAQSTGLSWLGGGVA